jgi:hypothetical protein
MLGLTVGMMIEPERQPLAICSNDMLTDQGVDNAELGDSLGLALSRSSLKGNLGERQARDPLVCCYHPMASDRRRSCQLDVIKHFTRLKPPSFAESPLA